MGRGKTRMRCTPVDYVKRTEWVVTRENSMPGVWSGPFHCVFFFVRILSGAHLQLDTRWGCLFLHVLRLSSLAVRPRAVYIYLHVPMPTIAARADTYFISA